MKKTLHNVELITIAAADQADRTNLFLQKIDELTLWERDKIRLKRVVELYEENSIKTVLDHKNAAVIFQHGRNAQNERDTFSSGMAVKMMQKVIELDPNANKWLLAAAIDRDLMIRELPQIYGTQYTRKSKNHPWEFYKIDPTVISDEERKKFNVETLEEQKEKLKNMNKKQLIELYSHSSDINNVIDFCKKEDLKNSSYDLSAEGFGVFGYMLRKIAKGKDALTILQFATSLHPHHHDIYHSLGMCLNEFGMKEEAIKALEKSLEINPNYSAAKSDLAKLISLS